MKANYNVTGKERKALVAAIAELTGDKAIYKFMPTCAFEIGDITVDKEGGVNITDCENVSRAMDPILDEKDLIAESYHFEVCSAGLERALKRPEDFARFMGSMVTVKLYRPRRGTGSR